MKFYTRGVITLARSIMTALPVYVIFALAQRDLNASTPSLSDTIMFMISLLICPFWAALFNVEKK